MNLSATREVTIHYVPGGLFPPGSMNIGQCLNDEFAILSGRWQLGRRLTIVRVGNILQQKMQPASFRRKRGIIALQQRGRSARRDEPIEKHLPTALRS
jgi:hypothetical protein